MNALIFVLALATFFSTLFGGFIILRFKESLHYFFAFAAGSIISVAFLDLIPESIKVAGSNNISVRTIMLIIVASFFFYSLIEKIFLTHHLHDGESHGHPMGPIGAGSLVIHSFLDGAAIGIAFQASVAVGLVVALAVIFHDMTDGVNTVVVMLKNKHSAKRAKAFLFMDAVAPILGILLASVLVLPEYLLAYLLAIFAGEFLYIGAASLLPETHGHNTKNVVIAMLSGVVLITLLTSLI